MGALTTTALDNLLHKCFDLRQFKNILSRVISTGFIQDTYAASRIIKISTNSQFVHIGFSHKIFTHIKNSNGFTWNTMMRAYIQRSQPQDAIFLYKMMLQSNVSVDNYTFPLIVQACTLRLLECEGREFHVHIIKKGFDNDVYVNNTLIHFYSECGNMSDAWKVFDESPVLDSVSWTTILGVYARKDNVDGAKLIYGQMPERNVYASNTMIALLGRCGKVDEARGVFDQMEEKELYSWTALISCYEQNVMYKEALDMFIHMLHNKCVVDAVVMVSVLSACTNLLDVKTGKMAPGVVVRNGFDSYVNLVNALIHMYSSCGEVMSAEKLFNSSCSLDQISWNSMLSSYLSCGRLEKARSLFDSDGELRRLRQRRRRLAKAGTKAQRSASEIVAQLLTKDANTPVNLDWMLALLVSNSISPTPATPSPISLPPPPTDNTITSTTTVTSNAPTRNATTTVVTSTTATGNTSNTTAAIASTATDEF